MRQLLAYCEGGSALGSALAGIIILCSSSAACLGCNILILLYLLIKGVICGSAEIKGLGTLLAAAYTAEVVFCSSGAGRRLCKILCIGVLSGEAVVASYGNSSGNVSNYYCYNIRAFLQFCGLIQLDSAIDLCFSELRAINNLEFRSEYFAFKSNVSSAVSERTSFFSNFKRVHKYAFVIFRERDGIILIRDIPSAAADQL